MEPHADILIALDGASLTIEQVLAGAYGQPGAPRVELSPAAVTQVISPIGNCASTLRRLLPQAPRSAMTRSGCGAWRSGGSGMRSRPLK